MSGSACCAHAAAAAPAVSSGDGLDDIGSADGLSFAGLFSAGLSSTGAASGLTLTGSAGGAGVELTSSEVNA
jgi:hypothetical protein